MRKLNGSALIRWSQVLCLVAALSVHHFGPAIAADDMGGSNRRAQLPSSKGVGASMQTIQIPDVAVVRSDGRRVSLRSELNDGRPVVLNFIFTSCPGVCPMMSQVFAQLQRALGPDRDRVHMVSISIDPEQDTPERLHEYAGKFSAGAQWQHYTGSVEASQSVQRAFGVYNGDKMSHAPVTFMRGEPGERWLRIDGLASGLDLLAHYNRLASRGSSALR
jgi:protein SCO1/2